MAPTDIPQGGSPDNQDVAFLVGEVHTRPGLQMLFSDSFAGNPTINYLKTFTDLQLNNRCLILDSLGVLRQEYPQNTLTTVSANVVPTSYGQSVTTFGREWMGFSDGKFGLDIPRQWDGTNFDRVSQIGPGAAPQATDENVTIATTGETQPAAVNVTSASQTGNVVTITTTGVHGLIAGQNIVVAGVTVVNYNNGGVNPAFFTIVSVPTTTTFTYVLGFSGLGASGAAGTVSSCIATYTTATAHGLAVGQLVTITAIAVGGYNVATQAVYQVPSPTTFTMNLQVSGLGAGAAGVVTNVGSIVSGVHKVVVMFVTEEGYITHPSPPFTWTAAGGFRVTLSNIPLGPANVKQRIVAFTSSAGASFFYTTAIPTIFSSNMVINENSSITATFDFTDAVLLNGTQIDAPGNNLFNLVELGEVAGFIDYASRLFTWGERNKIENFLNLTFDGSLNSLAGWTPINPTGGVIATGGLSPWLNFYSITGDGATATRGQITQSAYQDYLGAPILLPNVQYSVRIKCWRDAGVTQGNLKVDLFSATSGLVAGGLLLTKANVTTTPSEFIATITPTTGVGATVPTDLVLRLYVDGTLTNFQSYNIKSLEIFPTLQPYNNSLVRGSLVNNPESFDGVTGIQQYGFSDGTRVTTAFKVRDNLYFVKERSLWTTKDDGTNEPTKWNIDKVADIGTTSIQGVGQGEDWVVIAGRTGLFFFDGGEPDKISQEVAKPILTPLNTILPGWNTINWQYGHRIWCRIDKLNRRIMVGAPTGAATSPNVVFVLDYRALDTGGEVKADTSVHISGYTGKILEIGNARKWTRWNMQINSCDLIERNDGTAHVFMGNGAGTGKVYDLLEVQDFANPANFGDDGVAINSYYDTYFFIRPDQEEILQMGSHRKLYYYLTMYIEGKGVPIYSAIPPGNAPTISIPQSGNAPPTLRTSNGAFGIAITSVTRNGTVITVTTSTAHGLTTSDNVVLSGVTDPTYNGVYGGIKVINPTVFTVPNKTLGGNSSGGIMLAFTRDTEIPVNVLSERMKLRVQTNALGSWFSLRNLCLSMRADPYAPVRGTAS